MHTHKIDKDLSAVECNLLIKVALDGQTLHEATTHHDKGGREREWEGGRERWKEGGRDGRREETERV